VEYMDEKTTAVIDSYGKTFEALGSSYNLGRCFGLGMISGEPLTQSELAEALHISQSVVSTTVRQMLHMGMLEKVRVKGERSAHYQVPVDAAKLLVESPAKRIALFVDMLDQASQLDLDDNARVRVALFRDLYSFFGEHLNDLLELYEKEHPTR